MSDLLYYILCGVLSVAVLVGIALMGKVQSARSGNILSAVATLVAIVVTLIKFEIFANTTYLIVCVVTILIGGVIGLILAVKVKMIQMPELVALLNGIGGAASAVVGGASLYIASSTFSTAAAFIALIIGTTTLTGSLIAGGKLAKILNGRPVVWKHHNLITNTSLLLTIAVAVIGVIFYAQLPISLVVIVAVLLSGFFGIAFSIRVGGADMPITISLLNSLSGVAGAIAGMAIGDILLVSIGGIVGASGLLLTQIMCKAMNRKLFDILLGKTASPIKNTVNKQKVEVATAKIVKSTSLSATLNNAKDVIIVPGYGMALAQAQHIVKQLEQKLEAKGARVRYAIHPVAGRMPGHMNVLLCEADVDYDKLCEMDSINDDFAKCDLVVVVGANDVLNPSARDAEGTPIYGMPVLNVDMASNIVICNFDTKPGYAGVENPLYTRESGVHLCLGNASDTVANLLIEMDKKNAVPVNKELAEVLSSAKDVIIVPGYGMALAQAQHIVKQLEQKLEAKGARVRYAIHPVAGRMPGHMNVLLCEADVDYDKLCEMDSINDDFAKCDLVVVVGANDVLNPSARDAEGTPIYGMPVLNVDMASNIVICNFDTKPGYAGVENPLYTRESGIYLCLGNASDTVSKLLISIK